MSQVVTELTLIIELKRRIESSFIQREIKKQFFFNSNDDSPNCLLNTKTS